MLNAQLRSEEGILGSREEGEQSLDGMTIMIIVVTTIFITHSQFLRQSSKHRTCFDLLHPQKTIMRWVCFLSASTSYK